MLASMPRKAVSEKNTKGEILDEYRQLMAQVSGNPDPVSVEEKALMDEASKETVAKITTDLTQLKLSLNSTIGDLTERVTAEAERLATLQKAITMAQKDLEETQQVKVRAGMLRKMIDLQKEKEEEFGKEMATKRAVWEREQKEFEENIKRERTRSEEEYMYQKQLKVSRDEDQREEKKEETTRMVKELDDLRKRVGLFPTELEKAVKDAVNKAVTEVKRDSDVTAQLAKQQAESDTRLFQATIVSLEEIVKTQKTEIARLNSELASATRQVKEIAIAVAEGVKRTDASTSTSKTTT